jgi:hypothetical protein
MRRSVDEEKAEHTDAEVVLWRNMSILSAQRAVISQNSRTKAGEVWVGLVQVGTSHLPSLFRAPTVRNNSKIKVI